MRIVYFIDHLRPDGTQQALRQIIEGLAKRGHEQDIVCLNNSWDATLVDRLLNAHARVHLVKAWELATGYALLSLWRWLRHAQFDVAVTFLFHSDVLGRALAHAAGTPRIVSSLRARNIHYRAWQRLLVRQTMRWADAVIINSAGIRDFAITHEDARLDSIVLIPNGVCIDASYDPINHAMLRASLGLVPERRLIGSVGRLTHQKGFDLLIDALARLPEGEVDLLIVGTGELESRLRDQASTLGVARRVHFAGYRRDVPLLLRMLDLYVHPARFEGMPNALLEAMAAGCPIVASAVDGNRELIEDGVHGWLVAPGDASALAAAMQSALGEPAEARRRGSAAQRRAAAQFSCEAMVEAWEQVLSARS
jgi:glycosyltransferase involved in cell wall biosynthesis